MNKVKINEIRTAYKIALLAAALVLVINFASLFLVVLPIYNLVGNANLSDTEKAYRLERSENTSSLSWGATMLLTIVSLGAGGYGVYQDVRKKSKK